MQKILSIVWQFLQDFSGEKDYERYRSRILRDGGEPITRQAFYVSSLREKYSTPCRCC